MLTTLAIDEIDRLPAGQGVFVIETEGEPYINKSADVRRRVARLLEAAPAESSKRLNLRDTARAVTYCETGSQFESALVLWQLHRLYFPHSYRKRMRLRSPVLLKLNWENEYPRCYLTRRLGKGQSLHFGPFPSRAAGERFMQSFLDLFLIRRCVETIRPDPAHPGCIYGEMKMCLRPCQAATTQDDYMAESARVRDFLETRGRSLLRGLEQDREQAATDLAFERAAEIHKRLEKTKAALDLPDLACDLERLHGIVVQRSATPESVELFPVFRGYLQPSICFALTAPEGGAGSLDSRVRETLASADFAPNGRRSEQLALLGRWFYRGSRKGEWIAVENFDQPPIRRIVNAIGRVARGEAEAVVQ